MAAATARGTSDASISPTIDEQAASAILNFFGRAAKQAAKAAGTGEPGRTTTHTGTSRRDWSGRASGDS